MINKEIIQQFNMYEEEFKKFVKIRDFPKYKIQTKEASLNRADSCGFDSLAEASYILETQTHILTVSTNFEVTKDVIFHEFTHILDTELYTKNDKVRYAGLAGFTEYHASQVQLAQLLGAKAINQIPIFSVDTIVNTWSGEKSVSQYLTDKQQLAISLFERDDFPADISTLKSAIGAICNYYGLRSICEMYSTDYVERVDNVAFLQFIPTEYFVKLNSLMHGWLDENKIQLCIPLYFNIVLFIANTKGLK